MADGRAVSFEWDARSGSLTVTVDHQAEITAWRPLGDAAWIGTDAHGRFIAAEASGDSFQVACASLLEAIAYRRDDVAQALDRLLG